ncbi:MAG TPA: 4Fe-4S binding protein, partial [Methanobacteriaceae archaeon]|nr:4Fe-4S binding protein [Methanobacteriaceae archaeon]
CPNRAIFKNKYGGYVVDRAKCNACGVCELSCPVNNITIEDGVVKGICSRCGICVPACPEKARVDAYDVIEDRQLKFLESLNLTVQPPLRSKKGKELVQRTSLVTETEKCTLCRRCEYYCPTGAIQVDVEPHGVCTECRVCEDVCPVGAIENFTIDPDKCTSCLKCIGECPNRAIYTEDFQVKINKLEPGEKLTGKLISCLNCGLCADECPRGALKMVDGRLRYDPNLCEDCENMECLDACPVGILRPSKDPEKRIEGFCVSCGKCVKSCDLQEARSFQQVTWDGSVSDECISCGICAEICPKEAITLRRGTIDVDLDKCVLCEKCAIHCPVQAIPTTTMRRKYIKDGFT